MSLHINWRELLTTPYPKTGWGISENLIVVLSKDRKAGEVCAEITVPEGVFEVGPVGLNGVDSAQLTPLLSALQEKVGGCKHPSVVVPNSWVRMHLLDFDEVPGRAGELEEVVRWRLKKLLPIRPAELRIDAQAEKAPEGGWKVLSVSGVGHAWEGLESTFEAAGLQPTLITPALFAQGPLPRHAGPTLLLQVEPGMVTMAVWSEHRLALVHTRLLPAGEAAWAVVSRELRTIRLFLSDRLGIEGPVRVVPTATNPEFLQAVVETCDAVEGLEAAPAPSPSPCWQDPRARGAALSVALAPLVGGRPV